MLVRYPFWRDEVHDSYAYSTVQSVHRSTQYVIAGTQDSIVGMNSEVYCSVFRPSWNREVFEYGTVTRSRQFSRIADLLLNQDLH